MMLLGNRDLYLFIYSAGSLGIWLRRQEFESANFMSRAAESMEAVYAELDAAERRIVAGLRFHKVTLDRRSEASFGLRVKGTKGAPGTIVSHVGLHPTHHSHLTPLLQSTTKNAQLTRQNGRRVHCQYRESSSLLRMESPNKRGSNSET